MIFRVIFLSIFLVGFVSCNSSAPVQTTNMSNIIEDIPIEGAAEDSIELIVLKLAPKTKLGQPEHECLASLVTIPENFQGTQSQEFRGPSCDSKYQAGITSIFMIWISQLSDSEDIE